MRFHPPRTGNFSNFYDEIFKYREQNGGFMRLIGEVMQMSTLLTIDQNHAVQTLTIDEKNNRALLNGEECALTQQEFYLLQELAQHVDTPVSREQLLRDAWGYQCMGETRTVDVHIQRLRRKLGFGCIETVYRFGYKLCAMAV